MSDEPKLYTPFTNTSSGKREIANLPVRDSSAYVEIPYPLSQQTPEMMPTGGGEWIEAPRQVLQDFERTQSLSQPFDYILVRLPGRGNSTLGHYPFRFMVNPHSIEVAYSTVDSQSLTRNGWNFGVWGDDLVQISMSGKTPGYYFSSGLSDENKEFSQSYRNILNLQKVVENNGYWFEGEELDDSLVESNLRFKRIKCHEDVELIYNNFRWFGMFESLTINSTADTPYLDTFRISFVAWKERYRNSSPWRDSKHNDVKRGHYRGSWLNYKKEVKPTETPNPPAVPEKVPCPLKPKENTKCGKVKILAQKMSKKYGVSAEMLEALARVESDCNPNAVGADGELGLGQFMPATWKQYGKGKDPQIQRHPWMLPPDILRS
jgi:hypothetical protein